MRADLRWQSPTGVCLAVAAMIGIAQASGQCVPDTISTDIIQGHVYFGTDLKTEALADVVVELSKYGYNKSAIGTSTTDNKGSFSFPHVARGDYYLSIRHPAIIGLTFKVHINGRKEGKGPKQTIEITLKNDPARECGGAVVRFERIQGPKADGRQYRNDNPPPL